MADRTMTRYLRIWLRAAAMTWKAATVSRLDYVSYIVGKLVRMGFFLVFVLALFAGDTSIAGFGRGEMLLLFAIMNLVDVVVQLFWFRGFTDLARMVRSGDLDLVLAKPISPLFWAAFRGFDFMDLATMPAAIWMLWYAFGELGALPLAQLTAGWIALILSTVLAFFITLVIASRTFVTTELENFWWLYRYGFYVARFPPGVFPGAVQWICTYLLPMLVIVVFPTLAFLGRLSLSEYLWFVIALCLWGWLALTLWRKGIRRYTSASS